FDIKVHSVYCKEFCIAMSLDDETCRSDHGQNDECDPAVGAVARPAEETNADPRGAEIERAEREGALQDFGGERAFPPERRDREAVDQREVDDEARPRACRLVGA